MENLSTTAKIILVLICKSAKIIYTRNMKKIIIELLSIYTPAEIEAKTGLPQYSISRAKSGLSLRYDERLDKVLKLHQKSRAKIARKKNAD